MTLRRMALHCVTPRPKPPGRFPSILITLNLQSPSGHPNLQSKIAAAYPHLCA